jgi:penicillin-binding protein 2
MKLGLHSLVSTLHEAGIGKRTELELRNAAGNFPSPELKKERYGARWNQFDTALLSMGQGFISVTPLQMALIAGAFANGGTVYRPHLVDNITDAGGITLYKRQVIAESKLDVLPEHLEVIRRGMARVVNSPRGSGRRAKVEGLTVYGKTGTAEVGSRGNRRNITHFIAFTEYQNRRYACCITVEDGQSGSATCAPLAAAFFEHFLLGN